MFILFLPSSPPIAYSPMLLLRLICVHVVSDRVYTLRPLLLFYFLPYEHLHLCAYVFMRICIHAHVSAHLVSLCQGGLCCPQLLPQQCQLMCGGLLGRGSLPDGALSVCAG